MSIKENNQTKSSKTFGYYFLFITFFFLYIKSQKIHQLSAKYYQRNKDFKKRAPEMYIFLKKKKKNKNTWKIWQSS